MMALIPYSHPPMQQQEKKPSALCIDAASPLHDDLDEAPPPPTHLTTGRLF